MQTALSIQPVTEKDHHAWLALWLGYQHFYQTDISTETTDLTWQRFFEPSEPMFAAIAWQDGVAVGLVHFIAHRSTWTQGPYLYLQDLFVAARARGQGIGRALITHVYAEAEKLNASRVYWLTHETNQQAIALYEQVAERSGFIQFRQML